MTRCIGFLGVLLVGVYGQSLSDQDIAAAVKAGEANRFNELVSRCSAGAGFGQSLSAGMAGGIQPTGSFSVIVSGNAGRIASIAAEAKRLYKPFSIDDLPSELRTTPAVYVQINPNDPERFGNAYRVPASIHRVVLKSKADAPIVVQPATFDTEPVEWSNLMGGKVSGNRAYATFSMDAVLELPPGDIDVVVITQAGERKCELGARNRERIFKR